MPLYSHFHIGGLIRKKVIEVLPDGFIFKKKKYTWSDIESIQRYDSIFFCLLARNFRAPRAHIYLRDGKRIVLYGRFLQKNGKTGKIDFWRGTGEAYQELITFLEQKKLNT